MMMSALLKFIMRMSSDTMATLMLEFVTCVFLKRSSFRFSARATNFWNEYNAGVKVTSLTYVFIASIF